MKSIIIFNQYGAHYKYHNYKRTTEIAEYLVKNGYSVTVVCANVFHNTNSKIKKKIEIINKVKYVYVNIIKDKNILYRFIGMIEFAIKSIIINIKEKKHDYVYTSIQSIFVAITTILFKNKKTTYLLEIRDLWPETLIQFGITKRKSIFSILMRSIEKYIYKKYDILIPTMKNFNKYCMDILNKDYNQKILHINNGVNLKRYNEYKNSYLVDLKLKKGKNVFYFGSIGESNSVDEIIELSKIVKNNNINFYIVGEGKLKNYYLNLISNEKLENIMILDRIEYMYIPYLLSLADVLLITIKDINLYEYGLSMNKIFDYLASGKPILSNTKKSGDDLIMLSGWLSVNPGNISELKNGLMKLLNLPIDVLASKSKQAIDFLIKNYDFEVLGNKLVSKLEEAKKWNQTKLQL